MNNKVIFGFLLLIAFSRSGYSENKSRRGEWIGKSSTNIDFDSTIIDGKMKSPTGFLLQGRNKQSLSNMVKLRSHFKMELKNSRSAVKSIVR